MRMKFDQTIDFAVLVLAKKRETRKRSTITVIMIIIKKLSVKSVVSCVRAAIKTKWHNSVAAIFFISLR